MSLDYKVFSGLCPDESCQTKVYFPIHKTVIECPNCGQRHSQGNLRSIAEVTDGEEALTQVLKSIVWDAKMPKKGSDSVKVHGLSNYHCKLLSPLFTRYGMDKEGNPRLLSELGHGETANCGRLLSHRAFLLAPDHIDITGYGRDQSGSVEYLKGLLDIIRGFHGGEERLIPIHADGDGHCLVHALSRATTGREIFWHALRENLVNHLEENLKTYKNLFRDFIDQDDWQIIIDEADPYHVSPEGFNVGLGNIHIFALANVLKRPIVLLDSLEGIKNVADYTAIFVPALVEQSQCRGNLPLCIAWSGSGHNHFIPLVGVAGKPLPAIPQQLIPNIWGIDRTQGVRYLNFNNDGSLTVAGGKPLQHKYLLRLVSAMERVFLEAHSVTARLVADMHLYVYQIVGFVGLHPDVAIEKTREAVNNDRIFRCLLCGALSLANVDEDSLRPGGYLYKVMKDSHGTPRTNVIYQFPTEELQCKYDATKGCLVPHQFPCWWCRLKKLRKVNHLGDTIYENADPTTTPAEIPGQCCRSKHFWDGREYENIPKQFVLNVTLQGKTIGEKITWFFGDIDPSLNSNGHEMAKSIAEKHFGPNDPMLHQHKNKIRIAIRSKVEEYDLTDEPSDCVSNCVNDAKQRVNVAKMDHWEHTQNVTNASKRCKNAKEANVRTVKSSKTDTPSTSKDMVTDRRLRNSLKQDPPPEVQRKPDTGKIVPIATTSGSSSLGKTVKIRVSTSDGRQDTVIVDNDLDYVGLQNTVQKHFGIFPTRQVLKLGFPPKLLKAGNGKRQLGLKNGDRVTVEIMEEKIVEKKITKAENSIRDVSLLKRELHSRNKEDSYDTLQEFADLLSAARKNSFERRAPPTDANVDAALSAVSQMAEMTGRSEWEYGIEHPELFHPGGAFYNQFWRDIGLTHGRHCMLPSLPGRVFQYNGDTDQVELCLEPKGHFSIGPEITSTIKSMGNIFNRSSSENSPTHIADRETQPEKGSSAELQGLDSEMGQPDNLVQEEPMEVEQNLNIPEQKVSTVEEDLSTKDKQKRVETREKNPVKESKIAPGFTTLGQEPATISQLEVEEKRLELLEVLRSKKNK